MSKAPAPRSAVAELKVTGHLMAFDSGVFCVFNTPGAAGADAETGLPGVRISRAPAANGYPGQVQLSSFNADGWLGAAEDAALIRVTGGPAQVLVTIYEAVGTQAEPPKLQVIRLTADPAPAEAAPAAPAPALEEAKHPEVAAHIYGMGDVGGPLGEWMGERGSKRWIEGFGLAPTGEVAAADIEYQAVLGRGWLSPWAEGGQYCGSRGMSLPILGLRVRLRGAVAETHEAVVEATFIDGSTAGPVSDGAACEAESLAALEAFRVEIRPRVAASKPARKPAAKAAAPVAAPVKPAGRKKPVVEAAPVPGKRPRGTTKR